ncbi:serine/threonine-protein kinase HipA [Cyclobacterium xiamenense]|uniref:Serine/threonine-protein kinase HipA n=1 Tax=Cyclobacterium xiamenense TaxID=1297121 RepID=A0A1H6W1Y2_9BACT|nr:HipA domain-containing protein [Cyclobacterium xiamenense]SEJ06532.1 serine/threonine-protein kinase HipA [Cyclobacterium xiamenense]
MAKCLYCYRDLDENEVDYHSKCIKSFFGTKHAPVLPYRLEEMEKLAKEAALLSITVPGVQPKLSLGWIKTALENGHQGRLTIMDALEGNYILKPQNADYPQMPENEHLSMKLAELFKIDIVPANMIRLQSGERCFITKRIDRNPDGSKNHMIDFLQILELVDKYKGTMEILGKTIGELSVNTLLDKLRFFEITVFNYIIGNNDMHLKNFSMLLTDMGWVLSPFYDLLNVKLVLPGDKEDMALLLGGKKENFNKGYFDRLGAVLKLNDKQIHGVYKRVSKWLPEATQLINYSFLDSNRQKAYKDLIMERVILFTTDNHGK